jgi:hypothetical protein
VGADTAVNTIRFDWACIAHALRDKPSVVLTLGYNTAAFGLRLRAAGIPNVMNMDGIEWSRQKMGIAGTRLALCKRLGGLHGCNASRGRPPRHRGAPGFARGSALRLLSFPMGRSRRTTREANYSPPQSQGRSIRGQYVTVVARAEPENSILEIVEAFSARERGLKLVVLGSISHGPSPYHMLIRSAASKKVLFAGAIYDQSIVRAWLEPRKNHVNLLRAYALLPAPKPPLVRYWDSSGKSVSWTTYRTMDFLPCCAMPPCSSTQASPKVSACLWPKPWPAVYRS